jgi:hypothetical protein
MAYIQSCALTQSSPPGLSDQHRLANVRRQKQSTIVEGHCMLLLRCLHLQPFELQRWMHPSLIRLEDILPPAAPPPAPSFGKAKTSKNGVQVTNTWQIGFAIA